MEAKPTYAHHRVVNAPAKENTSLATLITALKLRGQSGTDLLRGAVPCRGWKSIDVLVRFTGGTAPTVVLQPLEVAQFKDAEGEGAAKDDLVVLGSNTAALSHNGKATITVNNALLFLAVDTVTGTPTKLEVLVSGAERDLEALRVG